MRRPPPLSLHTVPGAPSAGTRLCTFEDLAQGPRVLEFRAGDQRFEMFLHEADGRVVAYQNRCPHAGTPLDWEPGRFLDSKGRNFVCGTHGARFRIEDGYCLMGPCLGASLRPVEVEMRDDGIYVPL